MISVCRFEWVGENMLYGAVLLAILFSKSVVNIVKHRFAPAMSVFQLVMQEVDKFEFLILTTCRHTDMWINGHKYAAKYRNGRMILVTHNVHECHVRPPVEAYRTSLVSHLHADHIF
uniref:Uncharacterized protein n=1 Tax=Glossina austeni TaxID=7395 RepID=A0A1A9VQE3_GLOAU